MVTETEEINPKAFKKSMQSTVKHLMSKLFMMKGALKKFANDQKVLDRKIKDTQDEYYETEKDLEQITLIFANKPPIDKPIEKIEKELRHCVSVSKTEPDLKKIQKTKERYVELLYITQDSLKYGKPLSDIELASILNAILEHIVEEKLNES